MRTEDEICELADERGISYGEAERIYMKQYNKEAALIKKTFVQLGFEVVDWTK